MIVTAYPNHPARWVEYELRRDWAFIVFTSVADVNRFGARYRLARSFVGLELSGYSPSIVRGYNALTKVLLSWSAFEGLRHAMKPPGKGIAEISSRYAPEKCLAELRSADPTGRFFSFVEKRLDSPSQGREIAAFLRGDNACPLILAKAVRHIFVHGPLSPSANGTPSEVAEAVCNRLEAALTRTMDREFGRRLDELRRALDGPVSAAA